MLDMVEEVESPLHLDITWMNELGANITHHTTPTHYRKRTAAAVSHQILLATSSLIRRLGQIPPTLRLSKSTSITLDVH